MVYCKNRENCRFVILHLKFCYGSLRSPNAIQFKHSWSLRLMYVRSQKRPLISFRIDPLTEPAHIRIARRCRFFFIAFGACGCRKHTRTTFNMVRCYAFHTPLLCCERTSAFALLLKRETFSHTQAAANHSRSTATNLNPSAIGIHVCFAQLPSLLPFNFISFLDSMCARAHICHRFFGYV